MHFRYIYGMRNYAVIILAFLLFACNQKVSEKDIAFLNGYWQIEKAVLPDGSEKTYSFGGTFDYFEIHGHSGFRRKAMPRFDGTFESNDVAERVEVVTDRGRMALRYTTAYAKWQEELISISKDAFMVRNGEGKEYHYKRAQPINLSEDGKTPQ